MEIHHDNFSLKGSVKSMKQNEKLEGERAMGMVFEDDGF